MSEVLDPLALPLQGSHLIEASAGTGKTWTIAALYLRLVLGHGGPARLPGEILVMTFTKAATRELADRIRRRLVQAAAAFRDPALTGHDGFLAGLIAAFPDGPAREQAAWRLAMAAEAMDDAAVHTIDAWCQRMLREHAFDSGSLFDEELLAQEAALRAEAVRDYWRQQIGPLQGDALAAVLDCWGDVDTLAVELADLLDKPLPPTAGQGSLDDVLARQDQHRQALKPGWDQRADAMLACLMPIWADKAHPAHKALPRKADGQRWIDALKAWALDPSSATLELGTGKSRLGASDLQARAAALGATLALPDCFTEFDTLMARIDGLLPLKSALRQHAAAQVAARLQALKAASGRFGFADMLDRLDAALDPAQHGDRALALRERILAQTPVAMVDEFQDTSPVQLRIFDRLYRIADNDPDHALLLIGDPKQAIYGFRGADIYSYLSARRATAGRHHRLDRNHRSTQALVDAVNALFEAAEERVGEGAFMFRSEGQPAELPFVPVQAQGRPERFVESSGAVPALALVCDEALRNAETSRTRFAALCAERIVGLLNDPQAGFEEPGQPLRRLRPADIAVLVRSGTEAEAVRQALQRRGLASVYLSDKDSVFSSPEAADLLRLLQAVATPREARLARAALATALLGLSLDELRQLAADDASFDRHGETLQQLNQVWKAQGVLAMLRQALHAFGLPARWLATVQGERRLTNVLHLAELLQAASAQAEGEQALLRWLQQQMADSQAGLNGGDELVLRLESDAGLVQVVTVHKSKGLEYPVVFLPFAAHFRELVGPGESAADAVLMLPGTPERELVLNPSRAQLALAEKERQREGLRLLYVALTRARHALWVGLSGLQTGNHRAYTWHRSAIGYLLSGAEEQAPEQRLADAQQLALGCAEVSVQRLPPDDAAPPVTPLQRRAAPSALTAAPVYDAVFDRQWSIASYSSLVRDAAPVEQASGALPARVERDDEPDEAGATLPRPALQPWHRFPRGALAGNFLHDQLEWLAGEAFALDDDEDLQRRLLQRCERQGWAHRGDEVLAWLRQVCRTLLPVPGVALAQLRGAVPEMEFWFPSDGLQARRIDLLCSQHLQPGRPRPQLPERALKGMLMGFADLVFEHAGRWWVLDYKSNTLGPRDADYTPAAMEAAMLQHRYDVQAAIYLLALHRLLRARLGAAYKPSRHLGGAVYFFLRGVAGPAAGCHAISAPIALIESLDAMLRQEPA